MNPMDYCLALIKELRRNAGLEKEVFESYKLLENQVEDYMCGLLNQASLFKSCEQNAHLPSLILQKELFSKRTYAYFLFVWILNH